jgi:hypothetical protein
MGKDGVENQMATSSFSKVPVEHVPHPSPQFRRRAWLEFQRALDPLAPPKPLRSPRQH